MLHFEDTDAINRRRQIKRVVLAIVLLTILVPLIVLYPAWTVAGLLLLSAVSSIFLIVIYHMEVKLAKRVKSPKLLARSMGRRRKPLIMLYLTLWSSGMLLTIVEHPRVGPIAPWLESVLGPFAIVAGFALLCVICLGLYETAVSYYAARAHKKSKQK